MSCSNCESGNCSGTGVGCGGCGNCNNPCSTTSNTATCETLPSQIENFTKQFFGAVVKTEVNGVVTWNLPCNLDIGLENNPRLTDEGLACYFLRLFENGIIGLTGPQGASGDAGADGFNSYTVTLLGFTQPTTAAPNVNVKTAFNPAVLVGMEVFIATSGWYIVNQVADDGTLFLTLSQKLSSASGTITAGKLVVPTGSPGRSIVGPTGSTGPVGPQGSPGESFTETNDMFSTDVGVDYTLPVTFTKVDFNNAIPEILLSTKGSYLITACIALVGNTGVLTIDQTELKLQDTTISSDLPGSGKTLNGMQDTDLRHVVINVIYTTESANHTVALFGKCTTALKVSAVATETTITYVRLS